MTLGVAPITTGFASKSSSSVIELSSIIVSEMPVSIVRTGINVVSSVNVNAPITSVQSVVSVSAKSIIDLNPRISVKSWSVGLVKLSLKPLSFITRSAKSNSLEFRGIKVFSKSAKLGIAILPKLTLISKSSVSKVIHDIAIISASIAFFGSIIKIGSIAINSVSAKTSTFTVNATDVFSVSTGISLIKQKLSIAKILVSSAIAYVMNTKIAETTKYTNFDFIEIIRIGTTHYGVKSDGLYELSGDTDNSVNISATFTTNESNFGTDNLKNIVQVYPDSEDDCTVQAIVDGIQKTEHLSTFSGRKVKLGRGAIGRWWQFKINNVGGKLLRLAGITALVEVKSKRM